MKPYQAQIADLINQYDTDQENGLLKKEARRRLKRDGLNQLPKSPRDSIFIIVLRQFQNPLIYILFAAAVIMLFIGNKMDAAVISVIVGFNALLGTIQEGRTQTILDSLQQFLTTSSVVIRDGKREIISDAQLVVGDIVMLQEGETIPADARVLVSHTLKVDESVLTGESVGVIKQTAALSETQIIADQTNMVFKGTHVISGSARVLVVSTGINTEAGRLHKSIEGIQTEMPIKRDLDCLSHGVLIFIFIFCVVLLGVGLLFGKTFTDLLVMLTALFICVVPEGLPIVLTLVLVNGAQKLAKKNVLIKRLQAVDTLGRTDVSIIDKTGTLTRNEMVVTKVYTHGTVCEVFGVGYFKDGKIKCNGKSTKYGDHEALDMLATAGVLLNRAEIGYVEKLNLFQIKGEPLEAAMYVFAQKLGINAQDIEQSYKLAYEIPFDRDYAYHAAFYNYDSSGRAFVAGAPETLRDCSINFDDKAENALKEMLNEGLRVVAVGMTNVDHALFNHDGDDKMSVFKDSLAKNVQLIGFFGIQDSIRPEVPAIISRARNAGLRIVMATGDHKKTAVFVAQHVGIYQDGDEVMEGKELNELSQKEILRRLSKITVFARVTPEHKLMIVRLFHKLGNVVAMTGDGVNDTPSLVAADVGIAMGGIGSEVAKAAADVVLLDDSFASIINAIEQGRHILYTLRRVILYFFATNLGEVLVVCFALLLNFPLPILAAQILWLNLVTDGFLDIALALEPMEEGLLEKKWLTKSKNLIDRTLLIKTLYMAIPMGIGSMCIFAAYYKTDLIKARTMTLVTMALYQWFNAWNCRSETKSVFELKWFSNKWLILATVFVGVLQILVVHVPFLQTVFRTVPLTTWEFGLVLIVTLPIFVMEEIRKRVAQRWNT